MDKKIELVTVVSLDDLARDLVDRCSIEELIDFIGLLDCELEDIEFIELIYAWAVKEMRAEGLLGGEL